MPTITDIDHIAGQNDHWLFLASLCVLAGVLVVIWRFMVADREKLGNRLTEVTDRHIQSCENLGKVVADNSSVVAANTAALMRVEKKL